MHELASFFLILSFFLFFISFFFEIDDGPIWLGATCFALAIMCGSA